MSLRSSCSFLSFSHSLSYHVWILSAQWFCKEVDWVSLLISSTHLLYVIFYKTKTLSAWLCVMLSEQPSRHLRRLNEVVAMAGCAELSTIIWLNGILFTAISSQGILWVLTFVSLCSCGRSASWQLIFSPIPTPVSVDLSMNCLWAVELWDKREKVLSHNWL